MTNPLPLADGILKTDARGRVHTPVERREALLDEFEKSGASAKKFAAFVGIKHQTFASWVTKRRKERNRKDIAAAVGVQSPSVCKLQAPAVAALPKLQWMEAVVESDSLSAGSEAKREALKVHLPGGARVEIGDVRQIALAAELLRALAAAGSSKQLPC